jgi:small subunit ribosomal protein S1
MTQADHGPVEPEVTAETAVPAEGAPVDWLTQHEQSYVHHRRGEVVEGVVVRADTDEFLVDIGAKSEGIVPLNQIPAHNFEMPKVGETVLVYVLSGEDREGRVLLSLTRAQSEKGWRNLQVALDDGSGVEGDIVEHNRGGLVVTVEGVRGFVPLSQISAIRRGASEEEVSAKLESMKGERILLKVIELNRRRNRLILSERAAAQERRAREKDRLLAELRSGDVRSGIVSSICDFGAFVDLGGADGLIHLSEISWAQITHPGQVLKIGDPVSVYVVGVDGDTKKIALSLKRLQEEPWAKVRDKYAQGQLVTGRITKLAPFGAFAEIEPGIEGLIHISELSEDRITHPKQVVREGDVVPLKVIRIEAARHRLGLSLKQAEEEGFEPEEGGVFAGNGTAVAETAPSETSEIAAPEGPTST